MITCFFLLCFSLTFSKIAYAQNHLRVSCQHSLVSYKQKHSLYNHSVYILTVKIQEIYADILYHQISPHLGFDSCPNDVLYNKMIQSRIVYCI